MQQHHHPNPLHQQTSQQQHQQIQQNQQLQQQQHHQQQHQQQQSSTAINYQATSNASPGVNVTFPSASSISLANSQQKLSAAHTSSSPSSNIAALHHHHQQQHQQQLSSFLPAQKPFSASQSSSSSSPQPPHPPLSHLLFSNQSSLFANIPAHLQQHQNLNNNVPKFNNVYLTNSNHQNHNHYAPINSDHSKKNLALGKGPPTICSPFNGQDLSGRSPASQLIPQQQPTNNFNHGLVQTPPTSHLNSTSIEFGNIKWPYDSSISQSVPNAPFNLSNAINLNNTCNNGLNVDETLSSLPPHIQRQLAISQIEHLKNQLANQNRPSPPLQQHQHQPPPPPHSTSASKLTVNNSSASHLMHQQNSQHSNSTNMGLPLTQSHKSHPPTSKPSPEFNSKPDANFSIQRYSMQLDSILKPCGSGVKEVIDISKVKDIITRGELYSKNETLAVNILSNFVFVPTFSILTYIRRENLNPTEVMKITEVHQRLGLPLTIPAVNQVQSQQQFIQQQLKHLQNIKSLSNSPKISRPMSDEHSGSFISNLSGQIYDSKPNLMNLSYNSPGGSIVNSINQNHNVVFSREQSMRNAQINNNNFISQSQNIENMWPYQSIGIDSQHYHQMQPKIPMNQSNQIDTNLRVNIPIHPPKSTSNPWPSPPTAHQNKVSKPPQIQLPLPPSTNNRTVLPSITPSQIIGYNLLKTSWTQSTGYAHDPPLKQPRISGTEPPVAHQSSSIKTSQPLLQPLPRPLHSLPPTREPHRIEVNPANGHNNNINNFPISVPNPNVFPETNQSQLNHPSHINSKLNWLKPNFSNPLTRYPSIITESQPNNRYSSNLTNQMPPQVLSDIMITNANMGPEFSIPPTERMQYNQELTNLSYKLLGNHSSQNHYPPTSISDIVLKRNNISPQNISEQSIHIDTEKSHASQILSQQRLPTNSNQISPTTQVSSASTSDTISSNIETDMSAISNNYINNTCGNVAALTSLQSDKADTMCTLVKTENISPVTHSSSYDGSPTAKDASLSISANSARHANNCTDITGTSSGCNAALTAVTTVEIFPAQVNGNPSTPTTLLKSDHTHFSPDLSERSNIHNNSNLSNNINNNNYIPEKSDCKDSQQNSSLSTIVQPSKYQKLYTKKAWLKNYDLEDQQQQQQEKQLSLNPELNTNLKEEETTKHLTNLADSNDDSGRTYDRPARAARKSKKQQSNRDQQAEDSNSPQPSNKPQSSKRKQVNGEKFLQNTPCNDIVPKSSRCIECRNTRHQKQDVCAQDKDKPNRNSAKKSTWDDFCRFYEFRKLRVDENSQRVVTAGFLELEDAQDKDKEVWEMSGSISIPAAIAKYILKHVSKYFSKIVMDEKNACKLYEKISKVPMNIIWKRAVFNTRELCDICYTTLFNCHYVCETCGFVVCIDCYTQRANVEIGHLESKQALQSEQQQVEVRQGTRRMKYKFQNQDSYGWIPCTKNSEHLPCDLTLAKIITGDCLDKLWHSMHEICKHLNLTNLEGYEKKSEDVELIVSAAIEDCLSSLTQEEEKIETTTNKLACNGHVEDDKDEGEYEEGIIKLRKHSRGRKRKFQNTEHSDTCSMKHKTAKDNNSNRLDESLEESMLVNNKLVWLSHGNLLTLHHSIQNELIEQFRKQWIGGMPVVVQGLDELLDIEMWSPQFFSHKFGEFKSDLVDCRNGDIRRLVMKKFWDGYDSPSSKKSSRIREEKSSQGQNMTYNEDSTYGPAYHSGSALWKLKDWPPSVDFSEILPQHYSDFMNCLPYKMYTSSDGPLNLVCRLPSVMLRPDLGPKMYSAYGSNQFPERGTTNLHLDMSDAVNVMIYIGEACKLLNGVYSDELRQTFDAVIRECNIDEKMKSYLIKTKKIPGALWHVFRSEDCQAIRDFLNKVAGERDIEREKKSDPIHDQSWYLDPVLLKRLEAEHHVKPVAILQCMGDAILIPAGAPHQVKNLRPCVKVACDFVSPENVHHCLKLTNEFRSLPETHINHEDKLQIKNILYHTVKDCIKALGGCVS